VIGAVSGPSLELGNLQLVDVDRPSELHPLPLAGKFVGLS